MASNGIEQAEGTMQVMFGILLFLLNFSVSFAQQFPTRPVRLIVPFAPGGGSDYYARLVGEKMRERLGQSVIIDNRAGAGGNQGTELAINAAPDGHTIQWSTCRTRAPAPRSTT
jgi:tripartite-type tricarboxylate transporter receptor subunit TctC